MTEDLEIFTVDGLKSFLRAVNFMLKLKRPGVESASDEVPVTGALMASSRPEDPTFTHSRLGLPS